MAYILNVEYGRVLTQCQLGSAGTPTTCCALAKARATACAQRARKTRATGRVRHAVRAVAWCRARKARATACLKVRTDGVCATPSGVAHAVARAFARAVPRVRVRRRGLKRVRTEKSWRCRACCRMAVLLFPCAFAHAKKSWRSHRKRRLVVSKRTNTFVFLP